MQRTASIVFATGVLLVAGSCSLVIDVPADCTDADCVPYTCDADGVACRDACSSDVECASGFVCDPSATECLDTGCRPVSEPLELVGLPPTISEFDIGIGGAPEQLLVLVSRREGLGFQRFTASGTAVPDPIDEDLELVRLAEPNFQRVPYLPRVRYVDEELAQADGGNPRFVMGWRTSTDVNDAYAVGTFVVNPPTAPSARTMFQERVNVDVSGIDFVPDGVGLAAVWRTIAGQLAEVKLLLPDLRGDPGTTQPRVVSPVERSAGRPAVGMFDGLYITAFTTTGEGARNLVAVAIDDQLAIHGDIILIDDRPASVFDVTNLEIAETDAGLAVVWGQAGDDGDEVYAAFIGFDATEDLDPLVPVEVAPFRVGADWSGAHDVHAAALAGGYAVGWVGRLRGRDDVWVQRFGTSATITSSPLPVTDGVGDAVSDYRVAPTSDGLAVAWLVEGSSAAGAVSYDRLFYRRFVCDD